MGRYIIIKVGYTLINDDKLQIYSYKIVARLIFFMLLALVITFRQKRDQKQKALALTWSQISLTSLSLIAFLNNRESKVIPKRKKTKKRSSFVFSFCCLCFLNTHWKPFANPIPKQPRSNFSSADILQVYRKLLLLVTNLTS